MCQLLGHHYLYFKINDFPTKWTSSTKIMVRGETLLVTVTTGIIGYVSQKSPWEFLYIYILNSSLGIINFLPQSFNSSNNTPDVRRCNVATTQKVLLGQILFQSPHNIQSAIWRFESLRKKIFNAEAAFNRICLSEDILPKYTKFNIYIEREFIYNMIFVSKIINSPGSGWQENKP